MRLLIKIIFLNYLLVYVIIAISESIRKVFNFQIFTCTLTFSHQCIKSGCKTQKNERNTPLYVTDSNETSRKYPED